MEYPRQESLEKTLKNWKRVHDVHSRYAFVFDDDLLTWDGQSRLPRKHVQMTQKANPAEVRNIYVWPDPKGTGLAWELEIITDSDRYAQFKGPVYFQAFQLEWAIRRRKHFCTLPDDMKDAMVGVCPLCQGDLVKTPYRVGGQGDVILTQCWGSINGSDACDCFDASMWRELPLTKRDRNIILNLERTAQ